MYIFPYEKTSPATINKYVPITHIHGMGVENPSEQISITLSNSNVAKKKKTKWFQIFVFI
jgi:hypothetical protein